jgi:hypothetical protein
LARADAAPRGGLFDPASYHASRVPLHPIQRRFLAEDLMRRRRAGERLRTAAAQRLGRVDPNPHQVDAVMFALQRIPEGGCILAERPSRRDW